MYDRMPTLSKKQMTKIHDASMDVLSNVGVAFNEEESLKIFKQNGFKIDGKTVFFREKDVSKALDTAPSHFKITARNPAKSVGVGGKDFVFAPGYGAPFVITSEGDQRSATMEDYDNFCKLVQSSRHIDMNGFMMVEPCDVPSATSHLDMVLSNIVLCDKPFMGSPVSKKGAGDCIEMASIVWGGRDKIKDLPVTVSLINSISPLQFAEEMAGSLIEFVRNGQACIVASLTMAGASGPVRPAGVLVLQNAEIMAGLTLAQLVRPGAPIIYGSSSAPMDMRTGGLSIGAPELSMIASHTAQIARFYNLPSRSGGSLTDANLTDAQAGVQSVMALITAVRNGTNYILHACGILNAYMAMSYEKFIIDEEVCGMVRKLIEPFEITAESIGVQTIKEVGIGGNYLSHPSTYELCRSAYFLPELLKVQSYDIWRQEGAKRIDAVASDKVNERLAGFEKPDIDPQIESDLSKYVIQRKNG